MNQQNRVGGHRTVCTLHRSFASVRSAAVKMKRELQEKGLDVLCNNAGIMGDLDILVAQPLKHRQDGHPLPSNSSHPYLRWALLSPPKKKLPRKNTRKGKIYVAWRIIAIVWEQIAFSGQKPFDSFKTRRYKELYKISPKKLNSDEPEVLRFSPPPLFWREKTPYGKTITMTSTTIHLHDLSWTQNEKNVNVDSTARGDEEKTFRKSGKK